MNVTNKHILPQLNTLANAPLMNEPVLESTTVVTETAVAKKAKRFTEVDFNNPIIGASAPTQTYVESQKFRFRIGVGGSVKNASPQTTQPVIGLRTSF
jgi:hypothetical protein